jgi:ADP-heptose:LPS heptosyltransferase
VALNRTAAGPVGQGDPVPGHHPGADRGGPLDPATLRRVLVVRADNAGDVVMATPALRAVRAFAPRARIDLLASPAGTAVTPMIPELDGVLTVSASWQQLPGGGREGAAEVGVIADSERALVERVRAGGYDTMLVLTSFSQSPWPAAHVGLLAGIGTRVVHSREFGGSVATHWVTPPPEQTHQVDRCLHLLAAVGVGARGAAPRLRVPEADERAALDLLGEPARAPFAVLAPGASCPSRRYPAERFGLAARAVAAQGLPVRVAGPAAEAELVAQVVTAAAHRDVSALPPTTLPRFAAVVGRAAVALTNNSGGMHLADALGTPVAVAYAGTERHGDMRPRAVPAALLGVPVPCSPCRLLRCPYQNECLDVAPERLAAAACELAAGLHGPAEGPSTQEDLWLSTA